MRVGVPKEVKDSEYRVGLVPSTVRELTASGHEVIVERNAGLGAGVTDADYQAVGREIVPDADQVYSGAELVVKVKEPLAGERKKLRPRPDSLHLSASGGRSRADRRPDGRRRDRHRL